MPYTRLCPQCSASVNVRKTKCSCSYVFSKRRSVVARKSKMLAMKRKRQLEPESEAHKRRECDRLSKARSRASESECETLVRKEQNKPCLAKKRASESESEASLRKEHDSI